MISCHLIREARLRAGLSQAELGNRVGKAASAIGRWERGEVLPALETVVHLVRAAGYDLSLGVTETDDHDTVLILRSLAQPPAERLASLVTSINALTAMAQSAQRA